MNKFGIGFLIGIILLFGSIVIASEYKYGQSAGEVIGEFIFILESMECDELYYTIINDDLEYTKKFYMDNCIFGDTNA